MEKISNIYNFLKEKAPLELCESWDNSGMLINTNSETDKVLLTLDVIDEVINEAIEKSCQLIISHHPIIFKPLKTLSSNDVVFKLIQNNISVISMHTNLDATENGVNDVLAQTLGLKNIEIFANIGRKGEIEVTSVKDFADKVAKILNTKLKYTLPEKEIKSILIVTDKGIINAKLLDHLLEILNALGELDMQIKSGVIDAKNGFELFLLKVTRKDHVWNH